MKLSHESDALARVMLNVYGPTILHDLSNLYQGLKESERERGPCCVHGKGVAPMSRRLILNTLSHLALFEMKGTTDQTYDGRAILYQLLHAPLNEIRSQKEVAMSADKLFRVCEAAFDLASFSPELVVDLFNHPTEDLGSMFEYVISGYSGLSFTGHTDSICEQVRWCEHLPFQMLRFSTASPYFISPLTVGKA